MQWQRKEINTIGELFDGACSCTTKEEAHVFLSLYKQENEHAEENLGYVFGYASDDERKRLHELFNVSHPIFGSKY